MVSRMMRVSKEQEQQEQQQQRQRQQNQILITKKSNKHKNKFDSSSEVVLAVLVKWSLVVAVNNPT